MKKLFVLLSLLLISSTALAEQSADWKAADQIFGGKGSVQGEVYKVTWPRSDLHVKIGGTPIEPALALTSWAGFVKAGNEAMVMGDLVLLEAEYPKVMSSLVASGIEITALHNHLVGEKPRVLYLHYSGKGDLAELAKAMKTAVSLTGTPLKSSPPSKDKNKIDWSKVESIMGKKGQVKGNVAQFGFPLAEKITEDNMELPPSMGVATGINIQMTGKKAATTGDFVLLAKEVNPVIMALGEHGIAVTALHSHMLTEEPRLFFLHFWGVGDPEKIATGLKAALDKTNIKK